MRPEARDEAAGGPSSSDPRPTGVRVDERAGPCYPEPLPTRTKTERETDHGRNNRREPRRTRKLGPDLSRAASGADGLAAAPRRMPQMVLRLARVPLAVEYCIPRLRARVVVLLPAAHGGDEDLRAVVDGAHLRPQPRPHDPLFRRPSPLVLHGEGPGNGLPLLDKVPPGKGQVPTLRPAGSRERVLVPSERSDDLDRLRGGDPVWLYANHWLPTIDLLGIEAGLYFVAAPRARSRFIRDGIHFYLDPSGCCTGSRSTAPPTTCTIATSTSGPGRDSRCIRSSTCSTSPGSSCTG